jgi:hypothetical protein
MSTATSVRNGKEQTDPDIRHLEIPQLNIGLATLHIGGITPLITHAWSAKAAKLIEDKVTGKAKAQRGVKDPEQEWRESAYIISGKEKLPDWQPGKYYLPSSMFKHAFIYGVGQLDDVKTMPKTKATGWVFLDADPVLAFDSCDLRMDITRNPTQPVYRPQFNNWSVDLDVGYNANAISLEQVVALFDLGGFSGGIGEWRPSSPKNKSGSYGRFRVTSATSR